MKAKRFILMLLAMLLSVTGAWAQMTFISAVKISAEEGGSTNKERLVNDGYTVIDQDLNAHEGGRDIYIGYKTTTNPAEAITGILIVESSSDVDVRNSYYKTHSITYRGKKYYRCDSYGTNDDNCDLNRKSGGADITLYYTKDGNTNHGGTPLTELTAVGEDKNKAGYSYVRHWKYGTDMYSTAENDVYGNTNEGNGSYKIYLPYKFHTHNVTATFNWAADGNTCTANMSCDCGMKSTNVQCTITTNYHPAPTCTTDGAKTCTAKVNRHGKDFVSDAKDFVASRLGHNMVHHAMVEATSVKDGHYEYWSCSRACCDGSICYKDAEGTENYSEYPVIPICPAPYIDADGSTKEVYIDGEITNSTTTLSTGWYIVLSENVQTGTIVCDGTVNIILADGAKLTATGATFDAGIRVSAEGASLTIYGQTNQTGQLIANGGHNGAGIGGKEYGSSHDITINGGVITASGGYRASAIGGGIDAGSSNIFVNSSLIMYADGNNPPSTVISHTSSEDVSGKLSGKQYVIVRKQILGITITFDKQGGTGGTEQVTANENEEMPIIEVPTLEGYNFQGYYTGENGAGIKYYNADGTSAHLWDKAENTTLYACWKESVQYIDVDGATKYAGIYEELSSTNVVKTLSAGWYVVKEADVHTRTLVCEGAVNIILADGAKLTATGATYDAGIRVSAEGASLTIYGQEGETGQLIAKGDTYGAGIGGKQYGSSHDITINGGVITASGGHRASAIGGGRDAGSSNIFVNSSLIMYADDNNPPATFMEHTSVEDISDKLSGKKYVIVRKPTLGITVTFNKQEGTGGDDQKTVNEGEPMPTIAVPTRDGYVFVGYYTAPNGAGTKYYNNDGTSTRLWDKVEGTTLYAHWSIYVQYIDVDGSTKQAGVDSEITNETTTLASGWYIVRGADVQTGAIMCEGDAHLILADGAKLTATGQDGEAAIRVSAKGASLTIYGQTNQTGQLIANGGWLGAGIGGNESEEGHDITINGGVITAIGGDYAAGIGGGDLGSANNITINGGVITASCGDRASAIGGGGGWNTESSNTRINAALILKADENAQPTTEIEHTSTDDLASALRGKRYATLALPSITVNRAPDLDENFSTFYHKYADYTVPNEDATIYTAAVEDYQGETCLVLHKIEGGVIPANTAVIVRTEESTTIDLQPCADASGITVPGNNLKGANLPMDAPDFCYILSSGSKGFGFYKYSKTLPAHKAYLQLSAENQTKAFRMVFEDEVPTGIVNVNEDIDNNKSIYNLNGIRINKLQKGVNIVNGKKIFIK